MQFEELNERVITWAEKKEILKKANPLAQIDKTIEEVLELRDAVFAKMNGLETYVNAKGLTVNTDIELKDGLGDSDVTLKIQCKMQDLNPLDCLETALNVIEKRTGKIKKGQFVKD